MNMATESEALKNWVCPTKTHCVNETGVVQYRDFAIYEHSMCSGSNCPVWRWSIYFRIDGGVVGDVLGFCGLGGISGLSVTKPVFDGADKATRAGAH